MTFGYQNHFRFTYSCRQGRYDNEYNYRSCNHSCRPVSRHGMRSASTLRRHVCILQAVTGWTTSSPRLSSFTSCCAPKEREIGSFNSSAFDVSSRTFSSLATTTMQDTSHGIASKWLYYCLPWQRMKLRSVTRWSSTWSPYFFVFCWSVSNVRWNPANLRIRTVCRSSVACGRVWLSPERKQGSTHASAWSETVPASTP